MARRITSIATPTAHLAGPGKITVVNGQLAYATRENLPLRLDPQQLRTLLCYGKVGISQEAAPLLLEHNIEVAWLTPAGHRLRGRFLAMDAPSAALRIRQHHALADAEFVGQWARSVVLAKIASQQAAARHFQRHGHKQAGPVLDLLARSADRAGEAAATEELRGVEGAATTAWFRLLGSLLRPPWSFEKRVRRPPTDPVNAMLSLGYTWLLGRVSARAAAAGLEIYLGGLHEYLPGRPSLGCDLMEPLRIPAVDRWMLATFNKDQWRQEDFRKLNGQGVRLQQQVFGRALKTFEENWENQKITQQIENVVGGFIHRLRRFSAM